MPSVGIIMRSLALVVQDSSMVDSQCTQPADCAMQRNNDKQVCPLELVLTPASPASSLAAPASPAPVS